jgi:hemerythrin
MRPRLTLTHGERQLCSQLLREEHKQVYQHLLEKAAKLREKSIKGRLSFEDVLSVFVNDLVRKHILEDDKKIFYQV